MPWSIERALLSVTIGALVLFTGLGTLGRQQMSSNDSQVSGSRFALLYQLSQTFNSSLDLDEVLDHVMDEVIQALSAERRFVALRG